MSARENDKATDMPIAVIGMECFFPKATGLKAYWRLIFKGTDAITEVPDTHWSAEDYFDPDPKAPDHVYCKRGGFLDPIPFDPMEFGIPPAILEATDSSQLLGLMAAKAALKDAGYAGDHPENAETSVILGVTGTQEMVIPLSSRLGHPLWRKALASAGVDDKTAEDVIRQLSDAYVSWQESSFPGLLGNVVAGRISNRLDLGGTNCVVDAACASSLGAIHMGIMELQLGRSRMVVAGGVDTLNDIFMHMCFSKTSVLSPTGDARPFSQDADGTVLGEGIGILILKRFEDAVKDKDRVYAVIKGMGTASDGKSQSIYAPGVEGQAKALAAAYQSAGVDPATVNLIEAHGTGTAVGDEVEFTALKQFFSGHGKTTCALGSVKSMIGHTKAAAGAAGLIKTILSLHHKVLPATLKITKPDPNLNIENSPFYLNTQTRPWFSHKGHPRRAGVSSFGFGGSNFHAVLEEHEKDRTSVAWDGSAEIAALSADTPDELQTELERLKNDFRAAANFTEISAVAARSRSGFSQDSAYRMLWAIDASLWGKEDDPVLTGVIDTVISALIDNPEAPEIKNKSVFFGGPEKPGKIAFVFPGQGAQYVGMGNDLACVFPQMLDALEKANTIFEKNRPLTDFIYPVPPADRKAFKALEAELTRTDNAQPAIGSISLGMLKILNHFGLTPDAACGHSFGELVALNAAGWIDDHTLITFAVNRGKLMAAAGSGNGDPGTMTAVKAPLEDLDRLIANSDTGVILANRNNPNQGVLSGPTADIEKAEKLCKENGYKTIRLTVAAAFHSHLMADAQKPFMDIVQKSGMTPTDIPVFSNSLGAPYPVDASEAKRILGEQILRPVDFVNDIKNLNAAGVGTFLEVGPKTVLSGLIKAILGDAGVNIIAMDASGGKKSGMMDLAMALCQLAALGHPVRIDKWEGTGSPPDTPKTPKMAVMISGANYRSPKKNGASADPGKKPTAAAKAKPHRPAPDFRKQDMNIKKENRGETLAASITPEVPVQAAVNPAAASSSTLAADAAQKIPVPAPSQPSGFATQAFATVQEGLKSMQALQQQTTRAHEKFLEAQMESNRTLQMMIQSTQRLVETTMGIGEKEVPARSIAARPQPESAMPVPAQPESMIEQAPEASVPTPQAPAAPEPSNAAADDIQHTLLATVSDLTGYPVEMLGLDLDIEADLGIDSIKRVEILSTMEEKLPGLPPVEPEIMGSLKTLAQIIDYLLSNGSRNEPEPPAVPVVRKRDTAGPMAEDIVDLLLSTVSDLTGYPIEMLGLDLDIEADLGIDSIKRVEILSAMEEKLPGPPPVEPEMMGSLKTLNKIIAYLSSSKNEGVGGSPPDTGDIPETAVAPSAKPHLKEASEQPTKGRINRQAATCRTVPFRKNDGLALPAGKKIYISNEPGGLARAVADDFAARGFEAVLFSADDILGGLSLENVAGLILIPDFSKRAYSFSATDPDYIFMETALMAAKQAAAALEDAAVQSDAFFAAVTRLDGAFGFKTGKPELPITGGLAGLVKTAALEWPNVTCRCFDVSPDWNDCSEIAAVLCKEILNTAPGGPVEIGIGKNERTELVLAHADCPDGVLDLTSADTVLITGGARGVTAASAIALARSCTCGIALLGRSPEPFSEPEWIKSLSREADIKKAILEQEFQGRTVKPIELEKRYRHYAANREITSTLNQLESCGVNADYYSTDAGNSSAVDAACRQIRKKFGKISAVIHGAGVLHDRLIRDKTKAQLHQVFDAKVKGLFNILAATRKDDLKHLILFSSVAARTGNKGQADYAMANEVLNKAALRVAHDRPSCRVVSINWGPWDGGMVNAALKKEFSRQNIHLIPLDSGAECMVKEMARTDGGEVEVVIGGQVFSTSPVTAPHAAADEGKDKLPDASSFPCFSLAFERNIDAESYGILKSHRINGTAVVPLALMAEWFGHGALHENPGLVFCGFNDMRVLSGIKLTKDIIPIRLLAGKVRRNNGNYEVDLELRSHSKASPGLIHARTTAVLMEEMDPPPIFDNAGVLNTNGYTRSVADIYDHILFHGPDLHGMKEVSHLDEKSVVARVLPAPAPVRWMENPLRNKWVGDPLVLDSAFQMASLWCFEKLGSVSLPIYSKSYRQYRSRFPEDMVTAILTVTESNRHKMKGNFTFLDAKQSVIAEMKGFEAVVDESLNRAFKPDLVKGRNPKGIRAAV